jgi:hypothetical protein
VAVEGDDHLDRVLRDRQPHPLGGVPVTTFWYRWRTTISIVLAVGVFLAANGFVLTRISDQAGRNAVTVNALIEERITSRVAECRGQAEFRTQFPSTLRKIAAASNASSGGIDLTSFPEYVRLTDPRTAEYLAALERRLNSAPEDEGPGIVEQAAIDYEKENPVPDCKAVERKVREELTPR